MQDEIVYVNVYADTYQLQNVNIRENCCLMFSWYRFQASEILLGKTQDVREISREDFEELSNRKQQEEG